MTASSFGKQLRVFRLQCRDPETGRGLTQQKLGELLYEEMGIRYSGAAISDWERNKSKIAVSDRLVLASLIKILKRHGGIKSPAEANLLLEVGNYRALNESELNEVFPKGIQEVLPETETLPLKRQPLNFEFVLNNVFFNSPDEYQKILSEANEGPPPAWPRIVVVLINRATSRWTIFHVLKMLIWLWIWLITYWLIFPSLQWPFSTKNSAVQSMVFFASGSVILPLIIGAMVNTKDQLFWKKKKISNKPAIRLYVHQGAYIGFHVGYFAVFAIHLIAYYLQFGFAVWFQFLLTGLPLFMSALGAHIVPDNLWCAYRRLWLSDGWIFFAFVPLGPLWGWFFLEYHSWLTLRIPGVLTVGVAVILAIWWSRRNSKRGKV